MQSAIVSINLFGAVALLLFGLRQIKDGMSRALGARLRTGLAAAAGLAHLPPVSSPQSLYRARLPPP